MDLWLRIKSMNLTRKLEEIDNRKIGLATIRHCKLRQTRFIFSWRLYLGAKQSGFFTDSCFHYFRSSIPFLVLSRSRASPWRQQMAHGACNTISLLAKNEKVWRVLLHRAIRDYTRYIKRFSSGISVLPCTFPDVDEEKKTFLWNSCVFVCGFIIRSKVITHLVFLHRDWSNLTMEQDRSSKQRRLFSFLFPSGLSYSGYETYLRAIVFTVYCNSCILINRIQLY